MTIKEMSNKFKVAGSNMKTRSLADVVSGGSAEDFVQVGLVAKIVPASTTGYYNERFGKNAVTVIMERHDIDENGKLVEVENPQAVQVPLSVFDRVAAPYIQETNNGVTTVTRDKGADTVRATGSVIKDWKSARHAEEFMKKFMGSTIHFISATAVNVRAWDNQAQAWSTSELREQKVYQIDWVERVENKLD